VSVPERDLPGLRAGHCAFCRQFETPTCRDARRLSGMDGSGTDQKVPVWPQGLQRQWPMLPARLAPGRARGARGRSALHRPRELAVPFKGTLAVFQPQPLLTTVMSASGAAAPHDAQTTGPRRRAEVQR